MKLIPKISEHKIFQKKPIVLMHIGSAGSNFKSWLNIPNKSILVSLDGSDKNKKFNNKFKKIINEKVIISNRDGYSNFYITGDPRCSSL